MSTYMTIITALRFGFVKPEEFVAYTPDEKRDMYVTRDILWDNERKETELNLGWHAVLYKNFGVLLVADKTTEATITATRDYGISIKTLEDYSKLYQNKSIKSIGVALTPELLQEIPESLRHDDVWRCSTTKRNPFRRQARRYTHNPAFPNDHKRYHGPAYTAKHMQPMLFIPPDTIVEIKSQMGKSKENGFKLHPINSFDVSKIPEKYLETTKEPMWVPLTEAMRVGAIFDTDFVEYVPDKSSVSFSPEETETESMQTATTEYDMGGWHPVVLRKGNAYLPYLVATHCSKFKLKIFPKIDICRQGCCVSTQGKNQFEMGIELLKRYAKIYSSKELNVQAIPLNEELFDALNRNFIFKEDTYYLADTFTYKFHYAAGYPLSVYGLSEDYQLRMGLKWIARDLYGYKQCEDPASELSIRIAVPLPEDIMVQINNPNYNGSDEKKALKLKLASKEENSK